MPDTDPNEVEDILYYAIGREVEANVFYNLLAQYVSDPVVRMLCNEFAAEELEHKARLEFELMKLGLTVKSSDLAKVRSKTLSKPLDYLLDMSKAMQLDLPQLLLLAMEKEKVSFRLYIDLISMVDNEESRNVLLELAEEEARHKMRFEIEYDKLLATRQPPQQ